LKDGFDSAERRKGKITKRGEQILKLFDPSWVPEVEEVGESKIKEETRFCITDTMKLKQLAYQSGFVYITYPAASYILKTILLYAGIQTKGLTTNAEKFKAIVQSCKNIAGNRQLLKRIEAGFSVFEGANTCWQNREILCRI